MPRLNFQVPEDMVTRLSQRAKRERLSLSKYLAKLVTSQTADEWPTGYFEQVLGRWKGELKRPPQSRF
jgi:hypothetical protein